ncbi:PAS domain-containing protein [Massilia sp. CFBP 13647]|nr:PAS domain-containing protein [Massilia sp. CFBP 13647]MBD8672905.1 PAS domain-containing protein [Massilia sp. CFBP 13721]
MFRRDALPSIRSKLFTLILASVLPLLLAYVAFVIDAGRREALHVARDAATVTRALSAALDRDLDSLETAARVAAAWPTLAPGSLAEFHAGARQLLRPDFAASSFVLYGLDGQALLDTRRAFGSALPERPNAQSIEAVLLRGDARTSSLYRPGPGQPFVFSADVPVWRGGKVAYVLSSQVRLARIADLLRTQQLRPGWVAEIVDGRGVVAARSVDAALYVGAPVNGVLASDAAGSPEGLADLPGGPGDDPRHAAWMRSDKHGWLVAVSYPDEAARELLGGALPATVAASAGLLGLGLLLAWIIGGTIGRSVRGLVAPATAIGRGESLPPAPGAIRETALVAAALADLDAELLRYRSQLETRVADRTAELERLNVRLETVYATAPVGLCFVDPQLRFVMINDYLAAVNAVPAIGHLGRTLPELLGAAGIAIEEPYRRVLETRRALRDLEMEGEVPADPGVVRHWLSSYYPVFGAEGELVGINAVVIDITERKLLEQRNRDNEEMFRVLFEASGDAQALLAYNAGFVSANPAAARMFGCASVEEVLMLSPANASPEFQPNGRRSQEMATELMRRALDEGDVRFEWVHQRRDGTNFHADIRLSRVDVGGRGMMQTTIRDITERVAADAALRAGEAQLRGRERFIRTVTDNLPALVAYWDADERLRFANRPLLDWLGAADEAGLLGRRAADLIPAATLAQLEPYGRAVLAGRPQSFETALHNRQGAPVHVWCSYLPDLDKAGRVRGFYALHADVSALKLTEGRLVEALREAEQASRAKSEFLGNMSHEIRTPMNAIMGLARLLEDAPLPPRERAHAAHIRSASASLLGILSDLLDYARADAGQLVLERRPFELDGALRSIALLSVPAARAQGLEAVFAVGPGVPRSLRGDPTRLEQVLLNLVGNAIKFTTAGEIVLSVDVAERQSWPRPDPGLGRLRLRFAVRDTGIGIAATDQARLFAPFAQGDGAGGGKAGGIGLGLSIARRLVALMGGTLAVDSRPGAGSTFTFEADFGELDVPAPPAPAPPLRVLVADAHAPARAALAAALDARGCAVVCAAGTIEALGLLDGAAFDLAFVDAAMADLFSLGSDLPPTVLLAPEGEAVALPGATLLSKPFTRTALDDVLGELRGGAPLRAAAQAASLAGLHVLVVEDNAINQEVATHVLAHSGARVAVAADGRAALAMLSEPGAAFDAVLMDLQMPVMDGYEAARAIRALGLAQLPIVAMSANTQEEDRRRAFAAGMDEHLPKPVDVDALVATLARLTGRTLPAPAASVPAPSPAQLPGIDLAAVLPRFRGDLDAVRAILARFVGGAAATLGTLRDQLADADRAGALAEAHRLRGVAANLGASALAAHALALETALRADDNEQAARQLDLIDAAFATLQAGVDGYHPLATAVDATPVGTDALAQLLELLQNNNMKALAVHATLAPGLAALAGAQLAAQLAEAVATLRFEAAAAIVGALLERKGNA